MNTFICKHCGNPSNKENNLSLRAHERSCDKNLNKAPSNFSLKKRDPWNKGLSVKNNPELKDSLLAGGRGLAKKVENGWIPLWATDSFWNEERRLAKSEWRKQLHIDHPETHPNRRLAGNRNKMSYPERVAYDFISCSSISFEHNKPIDKYFVDFCIGNIVIEIDGARWHNPEKDKVRDSIIESLGYKVYRIDSKERIENRIREILRMA